jgi:hypothetical protein
VTVLTRREATGFRMVGVVSAATRRSREWAKIRRNGRTRTCNLLAHTCVCRPRELYPIGLRCDRCISIIKRDRTLVDVN